MPREEPEILVLNAFLLVKIGKRLQVDILGLDRRIQAVNFGEK